MECMDAQEGTPIDWIAALLHDIGKPRTRAFSDKTSDYTFYHHEAVGADMADLWLREYRFSNSERHDIVHLVRNHLICYSSDWTDAAVRRFVRRVGTEHVGRLLALGRADALGKGRPVEAELAALEELRGRVEQIVAEGAALGVKDLEVTGADVMQHLGVPPGPVIGIVLRGLLERVTEDPSVNERERLLHLAREIAEQETKKGAGS